MELISKVLLGIHIFAGFTSIVLFWLPIFTQKGGKAHRVIGKSYVALMWIVVVSATLLSIKNILIGQYVMAAFLGFLALITSNPLWYGIAILKNKRTISPFYKKVKMGFNMAIVIFGVGLVVYGIALNGQGPAIVMIIFGLLGLSNLGEVIRSLKNTEEEKRWIIEHIEGMLTTGIAAYTAFFVFGGNQFFSQFFIGHWMIVPWIAPTVLGILGIKWYKKQYMQKAAIA